MNRCLLPLLLLLAGPCFAADEPVPGTALLEAIRTPDERSTEMVAGISRWLHRESERVTADRHQRWEAAAKGGEWTKFAEQKRKDLAVVLGLEPKRASATFERLGDGRVRWKVFDDVNGEGVIFEQPGAPFKGGPIFPTVIVVPDADELPEECVLARRLAANGFTALVPVLVNRRADFSGNEAVRFTNQTHREWIYRQAFEMGRSLIGYEVEKILAAADALKTPVVLAGHGEGATIALRAGALDQRFETVLLSGAFAPHAAYEKEPIDRNLFGAWKDFGDAELAALISSKMVFVDNVDPPRVDGPPPPRDQRASAAAPGELKPPALEAVLEEFDAYLREQPEVTSKVAADVLETWLKPILEGNGYAGPLRPPVAAMPAPADFVLERQRRTVLELEQHTQRLVSEAERARNQQVWAKIGTPAWPAARAALQERLWASIGKLPADRLPPNPRTRRILETPKWTGYEVMLDVLPDVFAWGWLLVPKDLQPGERRPVVVCQHGLEGLPGDTVTQDPKDKAFAFYKGFAAQLADQGYITYAPHNPYRGHDAFRGLQRQANPLGLSLFSFIVAQHEVTTAWLAGLPFVDPKRIGFYGLSYGGKSAMRAPALVDRYALSICSGDFNEWIRKNVSLDESLSYMFHGEYEMPEWNLAWNANYAEMAMLIAPRPFMVERGHKDGVGIDEWVAYEYAKVKRGYLRLGVPEQTAIEWFDGPHTINGQGTFEFLRQHLGPAKR